MAWVKRLAGNAVGPPFASYKERCLRPKQKPRQQQPQHQQQQKQEVEINVPHLWAISLAFISLFVLLNAELHFCGGL